MEKVLIVFWSSTGNTEIMADALTEGCSESADVTCVNVSENPSVDGYDRYLLGCSSMGDEVLDEGEFEPWLSSVEDSLSGKKVALFGSYGWGDGRWMREWEERSTAKGFDLFDEGLIINYTPDDAGKAQCIEYGKEFMKY